MSVAPEVRREPEVEMRPEPEITTCEGSLGATRSYPTDTALFTFAEIVTAHASQEVTETGLISTEQSQTSPSHKNMKPNPKLTMSFQLGTLIISGSVTAYIPIQ